MEINDFENKKILLIVPHQDDEIHIFGNILASIKNAKNVYVLYTTNGDFIFNAKYRFKEALNSLKKLCNIEKNNVIFLGYSDQSYDQTNHMYNSNEDWVSVKNINETYAPYGFDEWNYVKHGCHSTFNKKNFMINIKEVISDLLPDIIVCNDLDFHPDHIMTSLCFEKALGLIIKENKMYNPIVLKTFAYENSYFGKNDFYDSNDKGMIFNYDVNDNLISNPYYNKKSAIIIEVDKCCYTKILIKNKIFKAILCHKSQLLVSKTASIINSNSVFWERNTKNLLKTAKISVSSGDKEYLNDFMLCDCTNVLNGNKNNIKFNKGIWIPEDNDRKKEIIIKWDNLKKIKTIRLYNGRINNNFIKKIEIHYNNQIKKINLENKPFNDIIIDIETKMIKIVVKDKFIQNGFSEIEVLETIQKNSLKGDIPNNKHNILIGVANRVIIKILVIMQKIYRKIFIR